MMTRAKSSLPPSRPLRVSLKALSRPDMGPHVEPLSLAMNQMAENYSRRLSFSFFKNSHRTRRMREKKVEQK